jgi:hypothetical protein
LFDYKLNNNLRPLERVIKDGIYHTKLSQLRSNAPLNLGDNCPYKLFHNVKFASSPDHGDLAAPIDAYKDFFYAVMKLGNAPLSYYSILPTA